MAGRTNTLVSSWTIGYNICMSNIVSYITKEQRNFVELPFNAVDSLVFSTLSYLKFEEAGSVLSALPDQVWTCKFDMTGTQRVNLHDILSLSSWKKLASCGWIEDAKDTEPFLHACMASRRMRDVKVSFYVNESSESIEKQFSAVTFFFPTDQGEAAYLAFRGTDGSFAGWKEDFNLSFKDVIPSQRAALGYLSGVASACTCPFYVGGHSKGGNLAEYAALVVDPVVFGRIAGVYNHDGPSFLDDPSPRIEDPRFLALLHKTIPESSLFGMMLEKRSDYSIVQSSALSFFQHEPFTWLIENDDFIYQEQLNESAVFFDEAVNTWLCSKTPEERESFINTIYSLFASAQVNTLAEFQENFLTNTKQVLESGSKLTPETKEFLWQTLMSLADILKSETFKRIKPISLPTWLPDLLETHNTSIRKDAEHERENVLEPSR